MGSFSATSQDRLVTCHPKLQRLFTEVVKTFDCSILCGHRSEEEQKKAVSEGRSKVLHGMHNYSPSLAVDAAPYPIDWGTEGDSKRRIAAINRFYLFAGFVLATAKSLGITVRWGGDWDSDLDIADNSFNDLVHFELKG